MYICIYVYIYVYIYTYICISIHIASTYIYIYIYPGLRQQAATAQWIFAVAAVDCSIGGCAGLATSMAFAVEYQKDGSPHAHGLVSLSKNHPKIIKKSSTIKKAFTKIIKH